LAAGRSALEVTAIVSSSRALDLQADVKVVVTWLMMVD
jgi:hypothetical protein